MRRDENEQGNIERVFDGAIAVDHAPEPQRRILVAPSAEGEFNALQTELTPVACVQLSDVLFEFDSSVVRPDARAVMKSLARLREEDHRVDQAARRPLSVFGHADPTGDDGYNKKLSGRRAQAVYGLLTRNVGLWQDLHDNPLGGDDWRGAALDRMSRALGRTGSAGGSASDRAGLFKDYMDLICVDDAEQPFELDPGTDFLAKGRDSQGKGDYQGCSEFNPVRVVSRAEQQRFGASSDKTERNLANAPNRRVVIFLFRAGSEVTPEKWPCPRAKEGAGGCRRRFHLDGDSRRSPQQERREFDSAGDTFACRFYEHRIATLSPCEKVLPQLLCCKHRGVVVDNRDPQGMGRLKVDVPGVFENGEQFAMPAVPYAGTFVGFSMLPPVGANVWVDFEQGDVNRPVWSGCFWSPGEAPAEVMQSGVIFIRGEKVGLLMNEQPGRIAVETQTGSLVAEQARLKVASIAGGEIELAGTAVQFNQDGVKVV